MLKTAFNFKQNLAACFIRRPEQNHFEPIDGLRALSVLWMIVFHCIYFTGYFSKGEQFMELVSQPSLFWLAQGHFGVDTFFVISGFLIGYLLFKEHSNTGSLNLKQFYYRRALRLLPVYFALLAVYGVIFRSNMHNVWANIFYVNNFLPIENQAMGWTWSLAIEEQFYIVFPLFLLGLFTFKRNRLALLVGVFGTAVLIRGGLVYHYDLQLPLILHPTVDKAKFNFYFDTVYDKTYTRFGGLVLGVICAYLYLFNDISKKIAARKILSYAALFLSLGILAYYFFGTPPYLSSAVTEFFGQSYYVWYRYVFSAAVAYVMLFSLSPLGREMWLGKLLSHKAWYPIAQLSYGAYLIHPMVILLGYLGFLTPIPASMSGIAFNMAVVVAVTLLFSLLTYTLIEKPFLNLRQHSGALKQPEKSAVF